MIRTSTAIATVAVVLSLFLHAFGLTFTTAHQGQPSGGDRAADTVDLGNAFADIADAVSQPVAPEAAPVPDPPVETPPEPDRAEVPTSEALVASSNPQPSNAPDTGSAEAVQSDLTGPAEPEAAEAAGGDAVTPPVSAEPAEQPPPEGIEDARPEPVETAALEPPVTPPVAPEAPVAPVPETAAVPVVPLEPEAVEPEEVSAPEDADTVPEQAEAEARATAVASSVRPRLPENRPPTAPAGQTDGATDLSNALPDERPVIESPLTVYRRDGIDLFAGQSSGNRSGGLGFATARGGGNADVTNYAGQVLVHLNRAAPVRVSARGAARVFFEINPDGTLAWVDIVDSTGSPDIERAAKEQVRRAAPFPVPPNGASRKLSFVYRIF